MNLFYVMCGEKECKENLLFASAFREDDGDDSDSTTMILIPTKHVLWGSLLQMRERKTMRGLSVVHK